MGLALLPLHIKLVPHEMLEDLTDVVHTGFECGAVYQDVIDIRKDVLPQHVH